MSISPESAYCLVLTTVSTAQQAETLARQIVETGLGACVQIEAIRSVYRWQGALCDEPEQRLSIKTRRACFEALERFIRANHGYETPEIAQIPITAGSVAYLQWVDEASRGGPDDSEPEGQFALP